MSSGLTNSGTWTKRRVAGKRSSCGLLEAVPSAVTIYQEAIGRLRWRTDWVATLMARPTGTSIQQARVGRWKRVHVDAESLP